MDQYRIDVHIQRLAAKCSSRDQSDHDSRAITANIWPGSSIQVGFRENKLVEEKNMIKINKIGLSS